MTIHERVNEDKLKTLLCDSMKHRGRVTNPLQLRINAGKLRETSAYVLRYIRNMSYC